MFSLTRTGRERQLEQYRDLERQKIERIFGIYQRIQEAGGKDGDYDAVIRASSLLENEPCPRSEDRSVGVNTSVVNVAVSSERRLALAFVRDQLLRLECAASKEEARGIREETFRLLIFDGRGCPNGISQDIVLKFETPERLNEMFLDRYSIIGKSGDKKYLVLEEETKTIQQLEKKDIPSGLRKHFHITETKSVDIMQAIAYKAAKRPLYFNLKEISERGDMIVPCTIKDIQIPTDTDEEVSVTVSFCFNTEEESKGFAYTVPLTRLLYYDVHEDAASFISAVSDEEEAKEHPLKGFTKEQRREVVKILSTASVLALGAPALAKFLGKKIPVPIIQKKAKEALEELLGKDKALMAFDAAAAVNFTDFLGAMGKADGPKHSGATLAINWLRDILPLPDAPGIKSIRDWIEGITKSSGHFAQSNFLVAIGINVLRGTCFGPEVQHEMLHNVEEIGYGILMLEGLTWVGDGIRIGKSDTPELKEFNESIRAEMSAVTKRPLAERFNRYEDILKETLGASPVGAFFKQGIFAAGNAAIMKSRFESLKEVSDTMFYSLEGATWGELIDMVKTKKTPKKRDVSKEIQHRFGGRPAPHLVMAEDLIKQAGEHEVKNSLFREMIEGYYAKNNYRAATVLSKEDAEYLSNYIVNEGVLGQMSGTMDSVGAAGADAGPAIVGMGQTYGGEVMGGNLISNVLYSLLSSVGETLALENRMGMMVGSLIGSFGKEFVSAVRTYGNLFRQTFLSAKYVGLHRKADKDYTHYAIMDTFYTGATIFHTVYNALLSLIVPGKFDRLFFHNFVERIQRNISNVKEQEALLRDEYRNEILKNKGILTEEDERWVRREAQRVALTRVFGARVDLSLQKEFEVLEGELKQYDEVAEKFSDKKDRCHKVLQKYLYPNLPKIEETGDREKERHQMKLRRVFREYAERKVTIIIHKMLLVPGSQWDDQKEKHIEKAVNTTIISKWDIFCQKYERAARTNNSLDDDEIKPDARGLGKTLKGRTPEQRRKAKERQLMEHTAESVLGPFTIGDEAYDMLAPSLQSMESRKVAMQELYEAFKEFFEEFDRALEGTEDELPEAADVMHHFEELMQGRSGRWKLFQFDYWEAALGESYADVFMFVLTQGMHHPSLVHVLSTWHYPVVKTLLSQTLGRFVVTPRVTDDQVQIVSDLLKKAKETKTSPKRVAVTPEEKAVLPFLKKYGDDWGMDYSDGQEVFVDLAANGMIHQCASSLLDNWGDVLVNGKQTFQTIFLPNICQHFGVPVDDVDIYPHQNIRGKFTQLAQQMIHHAGEHRREEVNKIVGEKLALAASFVSIIAIMGGGELTCGNSPHFIAITNELKKIVTLGGSANDLLKHPYLHAGRYGFAMIYSNTLGKDINGYFIQNSFEHDVEHMSFPKSHEDDHALNERFRRSRRRNQKVATPGSVV